ncbi:PIG-L deacetylase family protein [Desulfonauticus submarinus]
MNKKILIVAAHPDDEILGCGGTVARMVREGYEAYTLILGEGITSRDEVRNRAKRDAEICELRKQIYKATKIIGVKDVFIYDFPDNRFDTVPLLDIVKVVEKVKSEIQPDIIFTHYEHDLNIDHQITYQAVITATRPMVHESVNTIYSFEVLSSTEWKYPQNYSPNVFVDISDTLDLKIRAMTEYTSELCQYPHPRSIEGIKMKAQLRAMEAGFEFAEAFMLIRNLI